jgi:hypothetical protein
VSCKGLETSTAKYKMLCMSCSEPELAVHGTSVPMDRWVEIDMYWFDWENIAAGLWI